MSLTQKFTTTVYIFVKDKTMMQSIRPQIEESWKIILKDEFQKEYFSTLKLFLIEEKNTHNLSSKCRYF